ncbi:SAM-dependent methyltransferase [Pseudonocardia sp. KRD-169]|uniref:SAM-dependent methyltransferase n=1 Tax=Pseudonocardia abyssalis TaxID=2792008 RepID=A0ABS6UW31_9PSEU|nr:SAM-dependent methyltransferase [Pseudonocardia abyssalis]MBW0135899.1 SAM-dependent methyltransferase [Pseudonocardia abyssalis]
MSVAGSPVCTPGWLTLREPADADARSAELAQRVGGLAPTVVRDVGCGTGSMVRWLAPRLAGSPRWILHDRDPDLLARAVAGTPSAEGVGGDLTTLRAADLAGTSLVTASALLDLLTAEEVDALAAACAGAGCAALLALSVTGDVAIDPPDPLDAALAAAFDAHQRRTVDGRTLLGPDAGPVAAAAFARHGMAVETRPSPWRLGPESAELAEEWLRGWIAAAVEQRPDLDREAGRYLRRRLVARAAGALRVTVGHVDVLAVPS